MHEITWMAGRATMSAPVGGLRGRLSITLMALGGHLIRWAWHLAPTPAARGDARVPEIEFCREAGALEGAVYVDGRLMGTLPGVGRL